MLYLKVMEKKVMSPNSLANLKKGGKNHEPVRELAKNIRGFDEKSKAPIFKILYGILHDGKEATKDRLHAAEILLNRGWGKAIETVVIEEANQADLVLREYSLQELKALRDAMTVEGEYREISDGD